MSPLYGRCHKWRVRLGYCFFFLLSGHSALPSTPTRPAVHQVCSRRRRRSLGVLRHINASAARRLKDGQRRHGRRCGVDETFNIRQLLAAHTIHVASVSGSVRCLLARLATYVSGAPIFGTQPTPSGPGWCVRGGNCEKQKGKSPSTAQQHQQQQQHNTMLFVNR
uniref:Putative secreted protein n=1 Tax=Anopheles marajoara TaxID=58244 RepID=A0A2M4C616_9DIPT